MTGQEKVPFNIGDHLVEVTALVGLMVPYQLIFFMERRYRQMIH